MLRSFLIAILVCYAGVSYSDTFIQVRAPQGSGDVSHDYYSKLLNMALEVTEQQYEPTSVLIAPLNISQGRSFKLLKGSGRLDVEFAGTNINRENNHHVVRVPLTMGLLGTRLLVINKDCKSEFDAIEQPQQLQQMKACQGAHWPDSDILEGNGYTVVRSPKFEHMWRMLEHGKCDYFPRALIEGYGEVERFGADKFMAYDHILLSYRFPMYFFFADNMPHMAKRVEEGLQILLSSGALQDFLTNHPVTSAAFPLEKYQNSIKFDLHNPDLSPETEQLDAKFWLALD